jgi:hypothetical protein
MRGPFRLRVGWCLSAPSSGMTHSLAFGRLMLLTRVID